MKKYKIWSEGYSCTGNNSRAIFCGSQNAKTFKEACDLFFKDDSAYNPNTLSYWGCRLFDNEADARKSFG